jgi:hypothetical protein
MSRPRILVYKYAIYRVHEDWSEERQACCPQWMGYCQSARTRWHADVRDRHLWNYRPAAYIAKWRWLACDHETEGWALVVVRIPTRARLDEPIHCCHCFPRACRCRRS